MAYWLVKSESNSYSINDLEKDKVTHWNGVRNYQARNYLRSMKNGDLVIYYHSVVDPIGIVGLARVVKEAYPDPSQFDAKSEYFDPKATKENPRWFNPDLEFVEIFESILSLNDVRSLKNTDKMVLLQRGSRLSVQPVTTTEFQSIRKAADSRD